jgi:hypothetical protein
MRLHHTKNKGDLGILHAQLDLAKKGYGVLTPLTEHEAFDLVAYRDHTFYRVQVKYRKAVRGLITLQFKSFWVDRHRIHYVAVDKRSVDVFCIYCPDTDCCYYVDPTLYNVNVSLRILPTINNQSKHVRWAKDFLEIPSSVRGVPAGSRAALEEKPSVRQSASADDSVVTRP